MTDMPAFSVAVLIKAVKSFYYAPSTITVTAYWACPWIVFFPSNGERTFAKLKMSIRTLPLRQTQRN